MFNASARDLSDKAHLTDRELFDLMSTPEVMPLQNDRTVPFWLKRIGTWGELVIKYVDMNKRSHYLTDTQLTQLLFAQVDSSQMSSWDFQKKSVTSLRITRENYTARGAKQETIDISINLKPELKKYVRGW